ncbi:MAG TPA: GH3 auxin-responsive promoter family protein, partial [Saprospiraceae bacterium]|nr:GH3 auxin-responsive promoter family protein [Saprospiraceae bacterium]
YNASEGYFAIQDNIAGEGMLLLTNNDIFYEFVPLENLEKTDIEAVELKDVVIGKNYAMVISTSAGLWRYMPGDTVKFTSKDPYRIKVTGRTKHFINVFGEEVIISNTDQALKMACEDFGCIVSEYTVGPRWLSGSQKGGHEWMIEFERSPINLNLFSLKLDHYLQSVNSDYEAKRFNNLALDCLKIQSLPKGTFVKWLQSKGKSGGQHKVPRLSNSRQYLEEIKEFVGQ